MLTGHVLEAQVQNSVPVVGFAAMEGVERPALPLQSLKVRLSLRRA